MKIIILLQKNLDYVVKVQQQENIHQKDQIILATERGILADFWVPHEIESCNFQNLLVFRFPETSQDLISFRQLLFSFSLFQRGGPLKKSKNPEICQNNPVLWPR